jgi:hypothetical protein
MKKHLLSCVVLSCVISCNNEKQPESPSPSKDTTTELKTVTPVNTYNPYAAVDISPMDMAYFPVDYPILKMSGKITHRPLARVIYSRPHLQGRKLFKNVLKYGEPWRLGANEATEIEFFRDVTIQGKKMAAGRYVLYSIPQESEWTIVFNSNIDTWGLKPDRSRDVASFNIPVKTVSQSLEYFTIIFEDVEGGPNLLFAWDNLQARLPVIFK